MAPGLYFLTITRAELISVVAGLSFGKLIIVLSLPMPDFVKYPIALCANLGDHSSGELSSWLSCHLSMKRFLRMYGLS